MKGKERRIKKNNDMERAVSPKEGEIMKDCGNTQEDML